MNDGLTPRLTWIPGSLPNKHTPGYHTQLTNSCHSSTPPVTGPPIQPPPDNPPTHHRSAVTSIPPSQPRLCQRESGTPVTAPVIVSCDPSKDGSDMQSLLHDTYKERSAGLVCRPGVSSSGMLRRINTVRPALHHRRGKPRTHPINTHQLRPRCSSFRML